MTKLYAIGAPACRDCEGSGVITGAICEDGFERGRWREKCERCDGSGYEPEPKQPEKEEDADGE